MAGCGYFNAGVGLIQSFLKIQYRFITFAKNRIKHLLKYGIHREVGPLLIFAPAAAS
jgi:hypothetical protein